MSDITYKKFSELTRVDSLQTADIIPIAQFVSGVSYNSRSTPLSTLYNQTSGALIAPFTTSIQTTINSTLSSDKWNSTYSTVQTNSATWGSVTDVLTIFKEVSSTSSPNASVTVHALSAQSSVVNVDIALVSKGTGATLAQIPDSGTSGNKRGSYATDWQKVRTDPSQVASGESSVIVGGIKNTSAGNYSFVGGGESNTNSSPYGSICGGLNNSINSISFYGGIGAGRDNSLSGTYSYIGGGVTNTIQDDDRSVIGGGTDNTIYSGSGRNTICGGGSNYISGGQYLTIGGGFSNVASGVYSSIVGGLSNNTNNKTNAHIIGSNITAPEANYTYVNNISSQGVVTGSSGVFTNTTSTTVSAASYAGLNIIKAWVNFDGTGVANTDATINDSFNVSRVRKIGTGLYTIVFSNSSIFANQYYIPMGTVSSQYGTAIAIAASSDTALPTLKTTLSCTVELSYASLAINAKEVGISFIGR